MSAKSSTFLFPHAWMHELLYSCDSLSYFSIGHPGQDSSLGEVLWSLIAVHNKDHRLHSVVERVGGDGLSWISVLRGDRQYCSKCTPGAHHEKDNRLALLHNRAYSGLSCPAHVCYLSSPVWSP